MDTDPKTTPEAPTETPPPVAAPLVPEIEVDDNPAEAIREKGEPFDGNLA